MSSAATINRYTPQEYYSLESTAPYKSDFYRGEIFAMAGGTTNHSAIATNMIGSLWQRLRGKPCRPFESNLRIKIFATGLRCYPDISVFFDDFLRDEEDPSGETVTNPTVLFEVLSPSAEAYDRGLKANNYRQIESLRAYVLVSQDAAKVEMYERQSDGLWVLRDASGLDAVISLPSIGIELPLAEIYDRIDFNAPNPE